MHLILVKPFKLKLKNSIIRTEDKLTTVLHLSVVLLLRLLKEIKFYNILWFILKQKIKLALFLLQGTILHNPLAMPLADLGASL